MSEPQKTPAGSATGEAAGEGTGTVLEDSTPKPAAGQLRQFAACLYEPDDLVELRLLSHDGRDPVSRFVTAAELPRQTAWLNSWNDPKGYSCYCGANPRKHKGRNAESVALARTLFVDIDNATTDEIRFALRDTELPAPTLFVATGGGVHLYWRLDEPLDDLPLWSRYQRGLAALLGGDNVSDAPRIMRLPGFVNCKPDRKGALCRIVEATPEFSYSIDDFADALQPVDSDRQVSRAPVGERDGRIPGGKRNETLTSIAGAMRRRGCTAESIEGALLAENEQRCDPPLTSDEVKRISASVGKYEPAKTNEAESWQPFPTRTLPPILRQFVSEAAKAIGCDESMVALPVLAVCAGAIGNSRVIRLKGTWPEPSVLWAAVVAESGTLKSPAQDIAIRPLHDAQSQMFGEHTEAIEQYEQDKLRYEAELKDWQRKKGPMRGDAPEKPEAPTCNRLVVADTTVEALAAVLAENPRGVLLARDEIGAWLAGFDKYRAQRGGDVQMWQEAHRAGRWIIDRKTGNPKTLYIPRAAVSVTGTIQPQTLRRLLTTEYFENGLAARLLLAAPPRKKKRWSDETVSPPTAAAFAESIATLAKMQMDTAPDGNDVPVVVELSPDARRDWIAWYDRFAVRQAESEGHQASALSKLEGAAARFALVLALVRWASVPDAGQTIEPVDIEAGALLAEWFADEAERIYALWRETDESREQRELVAYIREKGGTMTARDLSHGPRRFRGHGAGAAEGALQVLMHAGLGDWRYEQNAKGGPTVKRFILKRGTGTETPPDGAGNKGIGSGASGATPEIDPADLDVVLDENGEITGVVRRTATKTGTGDGDVKSW